MNDAWVVLAREVEEDGVVKKESEREREKAMSGRGAN
jgi:hypothetical protein